MTLQTERLILRPYEVEDAAAFQTWSGNPANVRYMSFGPNTEAQTLEYIEFAINKAAEQPRRAYEFTVVLRETGAVIGSGGIIADDSGLQAALGWILHLDYHKQGYGTEFAAELIRFGFEELKLHRIHAYCAAPNYGSYRVMERNGMRREGICLKKFWARVDEEWIDQYEYAILAEEYKKQEGKS